VLDPDASGTVTATSLPPVLDQLGLPYTSSSLKDFFPAQGPSQLNLANYLDTLSAPLAQLSSPDELMAAFGAFDADDSGQIDVGELTQALLSTVPEPGEEDFRLGEREVQTVIADFVGRRAFGARGLGAGKASNKGEVFKYRDFMATLGGGGGDGSAEQVMTA
jgi:Ca2+-binding EF-hand superfamily protein